MKMTRGYSVAWVALLTLIVGLDNAHAAQLFGRCDAITENSNELIQCDVRADEPKIFVPASIITKVGDTAIKSDFEAFIGQKKTVAYLFLFQRTSHPRDAAREMQKLLARQSSQRSIGIYSFSDRLEEQVRLGANNDGEIKKSLERVNRKDPDKDAGLASGVQTALYLSLKDAVLRLATYSADRKALVLFADGTNTSSGNEQDVIALAQQYRIPIIGIGMAGEKDARSLTAIKELAEKSSGIYVDAGKSNDLSSATSRKGFVGEFFDYVENGGTLKMAGSAVPKGANLSVSASFSDGTNLKIDKIDARSEAAPSPSIWLTIVNWVTDNRLKAGAVGLASLGLLLLLGALTRRNRSGRSLGEGHRSSPDHGGFSAIPTERPGTAAWQPSHSGAAATTAYAPVMDTVLVGNAPAPSRIYAWLQMLDASSTRIPIGATSVRIGRHKDNDICLSNNTVHRQHAIITMSQDKKFVIRDLGGRNGVKINDQACNQKDLSDGDMIELGEVRMRFATN